MIAERIYDLLPSSLPRVIGDLPATAVEAVGIIEFDGNPSSEYFGDKNSSSIFNPFVKVVIRSETYAVGNNWAKVVKDTLHRYHDDTLLSVLLIGDAMYLGRSSEKLHEFQLTFKINLKE